MLFHRLLTIVMVSVFIFLLSCSKSGGSNNRNTEVKDTIPPTITIVTPTSNQQFVAGQSIEIKAISSDNVKLTQLHIHINNSTTGTLLRDVHSYPGDKTGMVEDSFPALAGTSYTIKVYAYDSKQNLTTAIVEVSAN